MKSGTLTCTTAMIVFVALAIPVQVAAQDSTAQANKPKHHHYKLIDLRTFGGPSSYLEIDNGENGAVSRVANNHGTVVGWGDTSTFDPYAPNCFNPYFPDCYLTHAFQWNNGVLTDLGLVPGGDASTAAWISDSGLIAGQARNGTIDPLIPGFPETRAVLWRSGKPIDLGTLGGNESSAFSVNSRGQVVGVATNTIPDPFSFWVTQLRAFLWEDGLMQDLGTLGGPEAWALFINQRGQVAGLSLTNYTPNSTTGIPTQDPFLWENGTMLDLGTLGGTIGSPFWLNERGQVIGSSSLVGDMTFHPFLWDKHSSPVLTDLGTLGGDNGQAYGLNDTGDVVGEADLTGSLTHHGFLWSKSTMTDLVPANNAPCSNAFSINSARQIVGDSTDCHGTPLAATLWGNGSTIDLNTLIAPGSGLQLASANYITEDGQIAGYGTLANGNQHAFLLIPCDDDHPGVEGCDYSMVDAAQLSGDTSATHAPRSTQLSKEAIARIMSASRNPFTQRYRLPGLRPAPSN